MMITPFPLSSALLKSFLHFIESLPVDDRLMVVLRDDPFLRIRNAPVIPDFLAFGDALNQITDIYR